MSLKERRQREKLKNLLKKQARKGHRGYPAATIAYYGPDDRRASKVAVGIIMTEGGDVDILERWFSDSTDLRGDPATNTEILSFIQSHGVRSVFMVDRIMGCPHEEGINYPEGETCPACPFWAIRDRFTGKIIH